MPRLVNPGAAGAGFTTDALYAFLRQGTIQTPVVAPGSAAHLVVTAGVGAWVNGTYVQVAGAGILVSHALVGASIQGASGDDTELDFAQGAAASEVVIGTLPFKTAAVNAYWLALFPQPLFITANQRVALRSRSLYGATVLNVKPIFLLRSL